jgi:hypothetical protein
MIKTIDVNVKEWFDTINGNSYFAGYISINYGMSSEKIIKMDTQYGYDDHYISVAKEILDNAKIIVSKNQTLWQYCKKNEIILRTNKQTGCKKRDLNII